MRMKQTETAMVTKYFIGQAQVTDVSPLPGGEGEVGRILAIGNMAPTQGHTLVDQDMVQETSLDTINVLVAGADCNLDNLLETIRQLKERHPELKVVLAEPKGRPTLCEPPEGVESVMQVSQAMAEVGRSLLYQQAGILAGVNAGMAAYLAFIMEGKLEKGATIATATTNLTPQLFNLHH